MRDEDMTAALGAWYRGQARVMPWRISPRDWAAGMRPDPYRVWLSEVMLQQTTVAAVRGYFLRFTESWPDVCALARAPEADVMAAWAGLGYYARARNLRACAARVAEDHAGRFPDTEDGLRALPGIGPYTAAAIAAIAFDRRAVVVDGNVERVVARLFAHEEPLPRARPALRALAERLTPAQGAGQHAQAMMDLGATICTPRGPRCETCPLAGGCAARARGIAAELPRKAPKPEKPVREGVAFVALRHGDGAVLLEQRPPKGLLGGMTGFPGCDWQGAETVPPLAADWRAATTEVRHTFTHFHLRLRVMVAEVGAGARPARGAFVAREVFDPGALPTLMRKVWAAALPALPSVFQE